MGLHLHMSRLAVVVAALPFTLGCVGATPYQATSWTGGYQESRLDAESFRVEFSGNGYTPRLQVENGLYFRCAELTVASGYDYFVVVDVATNASPIGWNVRYASTALIRVYKGQKPSGSLAAYDAREVMATLHLRGNGSSSE